MTTETYFTPTHRTRALSYILATLRADEHRSEVLADLSEDDLLRTIEAIAGTAAATLQQHSGGRAAEVIQNMINRAQQEALTDDKDTNND